MLWRQWKLKRRTPIGTLLECLSPVILISLLVGGQALQSSTPSKHLGSTRCLERASFLMSETVVG